MRAMPQPASTRARRSRVGLFLFLLLLLGGAWEIAVRARGMSAPTPLRVLSAAWVVAGGGAVGGRPPGAPGPEEVAKMAYRPLPYVMFGLKPDWTREAPDGLQRRSNSLGFRGREVEQPKPPGRYRIVCLGGSTTYSEAVGDADAYPALLESMLREARPGRDIEVVNAGVPTYTTAESLANLAFRVIDLQPDAIIVYHAANDYRPRLYRNFDSAYFHYRKVWDGTTTLWENGPGEMLGGLNPFVQFNLPEDNGDPAENAARAGSAAYRRNLVSMAGIAAAHGARTVFVSFACDEQGKHRLEEYVVGVAEHNRVMREVAAAQGALWIDMLAVFPQGQGLFVDAVHLNARGTAAKARIIADGLLKGLL
jgi:lysophospholipase L1-like esterase